jgi:shikimate kinase
MNKSSNLYLVGFMGSGKTVVGRRVAELMGRPFWDLDREIEKCAGKTIPEIFRCLGEAHFRILEKSELRRVSTLKNVVAALGGGTVCDDENLAVVAATGISVWLDAPLELLIRRCLGDNPVRPLFTTGEELERLLERRRPYYQKATVTIGVSGLQVDALARQILQEWEKLQP